MFELANGNMRNIASAFKRAEDRFACQHTAQPTKRYHLLFSDTVYAVSVFALLCLLAIAVVVYFIQARVMVVVCAVLTLRLLAAWPVYHPNNKMSV